MRIEIEFDDPYPVINVAEVIILGTRWALRGLRPIGTRVHLVRDTETALTEVEKTDYNLSFLNTGVEWQPVSKVLMAEAQDSVRDVFQAAASYFPTVEQAQQYLDHREAVACACMGCFARCQICSCEHTLIAAQAKILGYTLEQTMEKTFSGELGWK